jgi:hypothetical protein
VIQRFQATKEGDGFLVQTEQSERLQDAGNAKVIVVAKGKPVFRAFGEGECRNNTKRLVVLQRKSVKARMRMKERLKLESRSGLERNAAMVLASTRGACTLKAPR